MKKFAVVLSGCGQHDGSETHEVILTLLSLAQEKVKWEAFAPDAQSYVVNHLTATTDNEEKRSVIKESARLVRGKIKPLCEANISDFDAIIFPGGVGAVNTLCDWINNGVNFQFHPEVKCLIDNIVKLKKPTGFICIAPMMIPKIYKAAKLTIGNDKALAAQIQEMGCYHIDCSADDIVVDKENKVVSTPANMIANGIDEVYTGIKKLVKELVHLS
ncbi:MAG: isoprenoid biosynthesis protein ElbB [Gammaproteobacteria bacterium]|nr:MAG: isoprenoid biosynthesis protein ElbB [Gammaproteobacteria bacterium]